MLGPEIWVSISFCGETVGFKIIEWYEESFSMNWSPDVWCSPAAVDSH